jgi:hypothetical protein
VDEEHLKTIARNALGPKGIIHGNFVECGMVQVQGGESGRKYVKAVFNRLLKSIHHTSHDLFCEHLIEAANEWKSKQSTPAQAKINAFAQDLREKVAPASAKLTKVVTIDDIKREEKENVGAIIAMAQALATPASAKAMPTAKGHRHGHAFSSLHIKKGEYGAQQVSANKFVAGYRRNGDTEWTLVGEYRGIQSAMDAAEQALLLAGGR